MTEIEILIPYRFWKLSWTKKIKRKFAQSINELDRKQLLRYCKVVSGEHKCEGAMKVRLLSALYSLKFTLLFAMTRVQLAQLTLLLNPLLQQVRLTKQKLPELKVGSFWRKKTLYAPGDSFKFMRLAEFIVAHSYFTAYHQNGVVYYLDMLVATIYREQDPKAGYGDKRKLFAQEELESRAMLVRSLPLKTKLAVFYYFAGCNAEMTERYEEVFSSEDPGQGGGDWMDMVRSLPNDKLGTMEEIEQLFVHVVFDLMNRIMKDHKKAAINPIRS